MSRGIDVITAQEFDIDFIKEVEKEAGDLGIFACFQCGTCSGGCPISFMMDYTPRQIIRMAQLGMKERTLSSTTIWLCSSCNTCITRCPREVDVPEVMAALKRIAIREGFPAKIHDGPVFYRTMIELMKKYGRVHEPELYITFARKTGLGKLFKQMPFAITMLRKGKLALLPEKIESLKQFRTMINSGKKLEEANE